MALLDVQSLRMQFGERLIQEDVSFTLEPGTIFAVMGGSGCGKSTLLRHIIGLIKPQAGKVLHEGQDIWTASEDARSRIRAHFGVLFQSSALWSSMTVLDNVAAALAIKLDRKESECHARARELLSWVGMEDAADVKPSELSGGMKKRAGLARAIAGEPPLLFLDEPSAGLDPISSRRLDDLILDIRDRTKCAVMMVSHELPSLFAIADDGIFLDADSKRPIARGCPRDLKDTAEHPTVRAFLRREEPPHEA